MILPDNGRLTYLFQRYLNDEFSDGELEELLDYIRKTKESSPLKQQITEVFRQIQTAEGTRGIDWDAMFSKIIDSRGIEPEAPVPVTKRVRLWRNVAAAVLILLVGGGSAYLYFQRHSFTPRTARSENIKTDIMPGGNKAILTLTSGAMVILDSTKNGKLARQGNMNVIKTSGGLLAYIKLAVSDKRSEGIQYNTLTTPRGGQYQLTLSDGTKVWLNAASSIRYPVAFTGNERRVEITGEVYFEVVHNEKIPFRVQVGDEVIEDMGTHFNVNAYADEPVMKTTLLQGSIKMRDIVLKPGEQAMIKKSGQIAIMDDVDVDDAVAWKNGFFAFSNANLQMVMRKLSRWYDVDAIYKAGVINQQRFSGRIDRSLTLSQVLNGLKQTSAHFRIEADRKVVILP